MVEEQGYQLYLGIKKKDLEISGIISVTDDGGSSGRLREGFGILLQETLETV
ncbi:MAG: hypothetical protein CM15mP129_10750 [Chloroflexota bacterium]|nr:MAG: hypothetical protein CM15mP129_10750 [Chloroflexota bacterium]